jgi:folate-dependent phosphoribosylglycinamide formyltransferase PurN
MKTYFLFHDHWTQYIKADWAASQFPFDGFVVIERTRPWFGAYLWRRARRIGFRKVADEALLRLAYTLCFGYRDFGRLKRLLGDLQRRLPASYRRPPVYRVHDINSTEAASLLERLAPDACVLMVNVILRERIFSIPPLGMLVFHPGLTPEYRGPHSAFWAVLNEEFWGIGWSLLRVNRGIDTGAVLAQGSAQDIDPLTETHVVMQHKSHIEGISGVVETLRRLAAGETPTVDTTGRRSTNYTHPGLSDYLKYRRVLKELRRANVGWSGSTPRTARSRTPTSPPTSR